MIRRPYGTGRLTTLPFTQHFVLGYDQASLRDWCATRYARLSASSRSHGMVAKYNSPMLPKL